MRRNGPQAPSVQQNGEPERPDSLLLQHGSGPKRRHCRYQELVSAADETRRSMTVESAGRFESALSAAQGGAEAALKSAAGLTRELRKAKAAAASGQVREFRRALDAATGLADGLAAAVQEARESFDIEETAYLTAGDYAKELLAMAAERGVACRAGTRSRRSALGSRRRRTGS